DDERGIWTTTYNNSRTYDPVLLLNGTIGFNFSRYSISFLDLPAFDNATTNSGNWNVTYVSSPITMGPGRDFTKFNHSGNSWEQSVRIDDAFETGIWSVFATQPNYIDACVFNESSTYLTRPAYYMGEIMEYNFTLNPEFSLQGNYTIEILNDTDDVVATFPRTYTSSGNEIIGTIELNNTIFDIGNYYIGIFWNDSAQHPTGTRRHGSISKQFYILNSTIAGFISTTTSVSSGVTANFTVYYRTFALEGIQDATIIVYENSTGTLLPWGFAWTGSYQVGPVQYLGDGNYSIQLYTTGAPNGTYSLSIRLGKSFHQPQWLFADLDIIAVSELHVDVTAGATWNASLSKYIINPDNIPYVNDSVNSIIQLNITDQSLGTPIENGLVIGTIGNSGVYFEAIEVYATTHLASDMGLYNLTLNTSGMNATIPGDNETLVITCSASGYDIISQNITVTIDKIPTSISLQETGAIYEGGTIMLIASMFNYIEPTNPLANGFATVSYFIHNGSAPLLEGTLDFLTNGVYQKEIVATGLHPGNYSIYVNGTAFNCEDASSNVVNLTINNRTSTNLSIILPDTIRVLREFQIKTILTYSENGTAIPSQIISLNITIGTSNSFFITTVTDGSGASYYDYIIGTDYEGENITVVATYAGTEILHGSIAQGDKEILGKVPIVIEITNSTAEVRTGYSALYRARITINDTGENPQNRLIFFTAYYDGEVSNPFIIQQLYTDETGTCEYRIPEIADGTHNISVYFEYLGSTTVAYNFTFQVDTILPRWNANFTLEALPATIRFGQEIQLNLSFSCENSSISFVGLPVTFSFQHGVVTESYTSYIQENYSLIYQFLVPSSFSGNLTINITFHGNEKIASFNMSLSREILPKITVTIEFSEMVGDQYMVGTIHFAVMVTDGTGSPLGGLVLVFDVPGIDNGTISATTNAEGMAFASIDITETGTFHVVVRFYEESIYQGAEKSSNEFRMVNAFLLFLDWLPYLLLGVAIVVASALGVYRGVVIPKRNRERAILKLMYQRLSDVENIQYILIIMKNEGVAIFSKSMADVPIDASLISGFLTAISSFGTEIGSKMKGEKGGLEELSYRQFKIILNEGTYTKVAILLLKRPSDSLKEKLRIFNQEFEKRFHKEVSHFVGAVLDDMKVTPLIEKVFEADLLYPHQVIENKVEEYEKSTSKRDLGRKLINVARTTEFENTFYIRDMITSMKTKGIEEIKSFESIESLKKEKVVFALNPRTNLLIAELKPLIDQMDLGDRSVLFAIYNGNVDGMGITKFLKKNKLIFTKELHEHLQQLKSVGLIQENNHITPTGAAVVTLLDLIPDL
ncbi:MAG: hypothetical protein ACTSU9_05910, partial [Promethearchaeota archaeon]